MKLFAPKAESQTLTETVLTEAIGRIDEEAGVIRGVKVLGADSLNGRRYSQRAMQDAVRLYEGVEVNLNHPAAGRESAGRALSENWGMLQGVKLGSDGVYADLAYLKEHAETPVNLERIKRGFWVGLSHNAKGRVAKSIVESLERVHSVDLVLRPATNKSLFESEQDEVLLSEVLDQISADMPDDAELLEAIAASPAVATATMPAPEAGNQIKAALVAALHALAETADEATLKKTIGALMSAAKPAENKPAESAAVKESITEAVTAAIAEATKPLLEEIASLKHRDLVRSVMESHQLTPAIGAERLKALAESADEVAMKTLIESWPPAVRNAGRPQVFAAATQLTEQVAAAPKSAAGVRQLIRSR